MCQRSFPCLLASLVIVLSGVANAVAAPITVTTKLSSGTAARAQPRLWDDFVVFTEHDTSSGKETLWLLNLSTGVTQKLAQDTDLRGHAMHGGRVVWSDNSSGDYEISAFDIEEGSTESLTSDSVDQYSPDIWGSTAVWIDTRNGQTDIYVHDFDSSSTSRASSDAYDKRALAIFEDQVVCTYNVGPNDSDVRLYDLGTGVSSIVSDASGQAFGPDIHGTTVVWGVHHGWAGPGGTILNTIVAHDIESTSQTVLADSPGSERGPARIYDDTIVWPEPGGETLGAEPGEIVVYSMSSSAASTIDLSCVTTPRGYVQPTYPFPWEGKIVWSDGWANVAPSWVSGAARAGWGDLYLTKTSRTDYIPIAGANRYKTAVKASQRSYPSGASTVVIATGMDFPDALGGAALAGVVDGPLLLTDPSALPSEVAAEITRLGATDAYILGGTGAVSSGVESALESKLSGTVTRISGTDRYKTANKVADKVIDLAGAGYLGDAFIATGENFPDALGASPLSASLEVPILLTPKGGTPYLPAEVDSAVILGGTGVVTSGTESAVKSKLGAGNVTRVGGTDRYDTAAKVADHGVARGLHWDGVGIATGAAFPDALSGGAMLGGMDSVMLLTPAIKLASPAESRLETNKAAIGTVHFIGGTSAVNQDVRNRVGSVLE